MQTEQEAEQRERRVRNIHYHLTFGFLKGEDVFRGTALIEFTLTDEGSIWLDFKAKSINKLTLNGTSLLTLPNVFRKHRIHLESPTTGSNSVEVEFLCEFVHNGEGLHRFFDPSDGEDYIYSNLTPCFANRLFPCFDQPSLKATMQMRVVAPFKWKVISNEERVESPTVATIADLEAQLPHSISRFLSSKSGA